LTSGAELDKNAAMPETVARQHQPGLFTDEDLAKVSAPIEKAVLEALANPDWDYRTTFGIAKETSLPEREVKEALKNWPQLVRKSPVAGRNGQTLYTLRGRPKSRAERMALIRTFLTKTI
jgi:hypothetical protein